MSAFCLPKSLCRGGKLTEIFVIGYPEIDEREKITIDKLAIMIQRGFDGVEKRLNGVDK